MHSKYDIVLWRAEKYIGFMFDQSVDGFDQETSDVASEYAALSDPNAGNAAGVYGWRDQTTIPGVAMSDFRGGAGQRLLDSQNASASAFYDSAFVDCRVEGEVSIAPAMMFIPLADYNERDRITEAIAYEVNSQWVTRLFMSCESPDCVRFLETGEVVAAADYAADATTIGYKATSEEHVEAFRLPRSGDYLYNTATGEIMKVTSAPSGTTTISFTVDRSQSQVMGEVDPTTGQPAPVVAPIAGPDTALVDSVTGASLRTGAWEGDVLRFFGLRNAAFDYTAVADSGVGVSVIAANLDPVTVTSMVGDGHSLYVAMSDDSGLGAIWKYDPRAFGASDTHGNAGPGTLRLWGNSNDAAMAPIAGVRALCFAGGFLYYSTNNSAGFIADDVALSAPVRTAHQLSAETVTSEGDTVATTGKGYTVQPLVNTVGLVANGVWVFWVTSGGSRSRIYKLQAPSGFQLVATFPKGFTATCAESAFGNVYVGGYYRTRNMKNGDKTAADFTYEGAVYILKDTTLERLFTLNQAKRRKTYSNPASPVILDNRVKGITATSDQLIVSTPAQVYAFNVTTGGYWHMYDLPDARSTTGRGPTGGGVRPTPDVWQVAMDMAPFSAFDGTGGHTRASANMSLVRESVVAGSFFLNGAAVTNAYYTQNGGGRFSGPSAVSKNWAFSRWRHNAFAGGNYKYANGSMRFAKYSRVQNTRDVGTKAVTIQGSAAELIVASNQYEARLAIQGVKRSDGYWDAYIHVLRWNGSWWDDWVAGAQLGVMGPFSPWVVYTDLQRGGIEEATTIPGYEFGLQVGPNTVDVFLKLNAESWPAYDGAVQWLGSYPVGWFRPNPDGAARVDYSFGMQYPTHAEGDLSVGGATTFAALVDTVSAVGWQEGEGIPFSYNVSDGVGALASFDGSLVVPILDYGTCISLPGQQYRGVDPAFVETSDSYQNMATVTKMYRRLETSHSKFVDAQQNLGVELYMDGNSDPSLNSDRFSSSAKNTDYFTSWDMDLNARKYHSRVYLSDGGNLRRNDERLRLNVLAMRFLPASGPTKRICVFDCTDRVEYRDGTRYDVDAQQAIDFIRAAKRNSAIVTVERSLEESFDAFVESYQIKDVKQDEDTISGRQAQMQVTFRVIVE